MKSRFEDEWGTPLGADKNEAHEATPKKRPKKDTLSGLVKDFHDRLMLDTSNLMNAQVNAPALMKAFRKVLDTGRTHEDARQMIIQFHKDIAIKPLTGGIPAWQAFISRLDSLALKTQTHEVEYDYNGPKIDPRLMKDTDD